MKDKYDKAGILIRPTVKLESEMDIVVKPYDDLVSENRELLAENARLRAEIDAANAQGPISNVDVFYDTSDYEIGRDRRLTWETFGSNFKSLGVGKHKLYTRPIPAQQSIDRDTIINVLLSVGNMSEGVIADAIISAIGAQQSQVVAVPEQSNKDLIFEIMEIPISYGSADGVKYVYPSREEAIAIIKALQASAPPRITEQDAREIIKSFDKFQRDYILSMGIDLRVDQWIANKDNYIGRALLVKLNKVNHETN